MCKANILQNGAVFQSYAELLQPRVHIWRAAGRAHLDTWCILLFVLCVRAE